MPNDDVYKSEVGMEMTEALRNYKTGKALKTSFGEIEIATLSDRNVEFCSIILKKNQTRIKKDIEEKILSMYSKGMTASDIESHIQNA